MNFTETQPQAQTEATSQAQTDAQKEQALQEQLAIIGQLNKMQGDIDAYFDDLCDLIVDGFHRSAEDYCLEKQTIYQLSAYIMAGVRALGVMHKVSVMAHKRA